MHILGIGKPEFAEGNPVIQAYRHEHKQSSHRARIRHREGLQPTGEGFGESLLLDTGRFIGRSLLKGLDVLGRAWENLTEPHAESGSLASSRIAEVVVASEIETKIA